MIQTSRYAAIVLAGGHSQRLGGADKALVEFAGSTLLDRVLAAVADAVTVTVVGPERPTTRPVLWRQENPVGGGPVAAFGAGLTATTGVDLVLLLATDLPFIADAVPVLLAALTPGIDVSMLRDYAGRSNYLASAWRRDAAIRQMAAINDPTGAPMRTLLKGLIVAEVADTGGWGFDCDTPQALEIARQRESEKAS